MHLRTLLQHKNIVQIFDLLVSRFVHQRGICVANKALGDDFWREHLLARESDGFVEVQVDNVNLFMLRTWVCNYGTEHRVRTLGPQLLRLDYGLVLCVQKIDQK